MYMSLPPNPPRDTPADHGFPFPQRLGPSGAFGAQEDLDGHHHEDALVDIAHLYRTPNALASCSTSREGCGVGGGKWQVLQRWPSLGTSGATV